MDYIELTCQITPFTEDIADLLIAQLGELEFESFTQNDNAVQAYVQKDLFNMAQVNKLFINDLPGAMFKIEYSNKLIEGQDWNELWESNFQPVIITDQVVIRASYHLDTPKVPYDIVINPKMSFGTGHHSTTSLMVQTILEADIENKQVLDMGCGTSILAILASMRGAKNICAIDIDQWAYNNSIENIKINNTKNINLHLGDASLLKNKSFDIVLANINRNILVNDMKLYIDCLPKHGKLIMSGYYSEDLKYVKAEAEKNNMIYVSHKEDQNWVAALFEKK